MIGPGILVCTRCHAIIDRAWRGTWCPKCKDYLELFDRIYVHMTDYPTIKPTSKVEKLEAIWDFKDSIEFRMEKVEKRLTADNFDNDDRKEIRREIEDLLEDTKIAADYILERIAEKQDGD